MADVERKLKDERRPVVAETVVDIPETIIDDDFRPIMVSGDITFDSNTVLLGEGRMAACASSETFTIHADEVIGSGSQGMVVWATDSSGAEYAAKISYPITTARERRNHKAVLESLVSLMDEHPLGRNHYKQTHLMPLFAYGKIAGPAGSGSPEYNVAIMALCDSSLGDGHGCSYEEIRRTVLPQTAEGLRGLHAQGIVHRDIKPKNLYMLDGSIVLGDYGISSLLDEGKDTGATVFDKRTPGYSPHSSVVQRENDWYALGYTIWTLYNHGEHPHQALIDAGDLSAVLAGKHPVEFIPNNPGESTLRDLIYGLTLEAPRGRLGYKDIQEWLDDPASFRFESPFDVAESAKAYQFRGHAYTDKSELADAMADHWDEAKDHLFSQTLEDHFRAIGQHDLAVALHRIVEDDRLCSAKKDLGLAIALTELKDSPDVFVWHGIWQRREGVADRMFASLTVEPYIFYRSCGDRETIEDLLGMLLVASAGSKGRRAHEAVLRTSYVEIPGSDDVFLIGDKLLVLFEMLCENTEMVRRFFLDFGMYGSAVWMKSHIGFYIGKTQRAQDAVKAVRECGLPEPKTVSIETMRGSLEKLDSYTGNLSALLPDNPFISVLGIIEDREVSISSGLAYTCARAYGERCTIGFAQSIVGPQDQATICDYEGLRSAAVIQARHEADRIASTANEVSSERLIDGHSAFRHILLMICTVMVCVFGWDASKDIFASCLRLNDLYQPAMLAGGAFVPDFLLSGSFGFDGTFYLGLMGFTGAALCVLAHRALQGIPILFASFIRKRRLASAERLRRKADALQERSLSSSIESLMDHSQGGSFAGWSNMRFAVRGDDALFMRAQRIVLVIYRICICMLVAGILGAIIASVPYPLFWGTIQANPTMLPAVLLTAQGTVAVGMMIYVAVVLGISRFRPNMIAVVFIAAMLPALCSLAQVAATAM